MGKYHKSDRHDPNGRQHQPRQFRPEPYQSQNKLERPKYISESITYTDFSDNHKNNLCPISRKVRTFPRKSVVLLFPESKSFIVAFVRLTQST
jgi:hypothetical protein